MANSHLKLRPILDTDPVSEDSAIRPAGPDLRAWLIGAAVALVMWLIVQFAFAQMRMFVVQGSIAITTTSPKLQQAALTRHLGRLYLTALQTPAAGADTPTSVAQLVSDHKLQIYAGNEKTIVLVAEDTSANVARDLIKRLQTGYIMDFEQLQNQQTLNSQHANEKQLAEKNRLTDRYRLAQNAFDEFNRSVSTAGPLDAAIPAMGKKLGERLTSLAELGNRLTDLRDQMYRADMELRNPTVQIDAKRFEQIALANPQYAGDHRMLQAKHDQYVNAFTEQASAVEGRLESLQKSLKTLSSGITRQLELELPAKLADDLMELNLAGELYQGQIAEFQKRWPDYRDTMMKSLSDATTADYDGLQTTLSKVRQDLTQRCENLPTQLNTLFDRLSTGSDSPAEKPGQLSRAAVRNIASSTLRHDVEQVLTSWRQTTDQIDAMFPESNVQLRTVGRVARSLQTRLAAKEQRIREELTQEYLVAAKKHAREELDKLQAQFQQASAEMTTGYEDLGTLQKSLSKLTDSWPEWQKLSRQLDTAKAEITATTEVLAGAHIDVWDEVLTAGDLETSRTSRAGVIGRHETFFSLIVALAAGALAALIAPHVNTSHRWWPSDFSWLRRRPEWTRWPR